MDFSSIPLKIITQEREYVDDQTLDTDRMIAELEAYKGKSSTSCPNSEDWMESFQGADEIFGVAIQRIIGFLRSSSYGEEALFTGDEQ